MNTTTLPPVFGAKILELLEDFVSEPQLVTEVQSELAVISKNFDKLISVLKKDVKDLKDEVGERDEKIEALKEELRNLNSQEDEVTRLEKEIGDLKNELEAAEDYTARAQENKFALIKVFTLDQQEKLRAFAESELWPDYNQQKDYINI